LIEDEQSKTRFFFKLTVSKLKNLCQNISHTMDLSLKMIAAVSILTLKVNITRAPVKECSAFQIKQ